MNKRNTTVRVCVLLDFGLLRMYKTDVGTYLSCDDIYTMMEREQIYAYPIMPRYRLDDTNIDICELDDAAMFIAQVGYPNSDALIKAINDAYREVMHEDNAGNSK